MSKKFFNKKSNWLKFKKYYLKLKPSKLESVQKIRERVKVTFNEQPEINRVDDVRAGSSLTRAVITTNDSSKADSYLPKNMIYMNDDAKNLYNGMMIRNYKMQQEINAYARHHRIQNQRRMALVKLQEQKKEAALSPIVIFDGD